MRRLSWGEQIQRMLPSALFVAIFAGLVGAFYGYIMAQILDRLVTWQVMVYGATRGIFVAVIVLLLELLVHRKKVQKRLRSMAFVPAFLLRSAITAWHLVAALALSHWVLSPAWANFWLWAQKGLPRDFIFAAATAFVVQLILQARRLVGARTLRHFLMGRYNRPVQEERIFVLADMVGSTAIAEKLGDQKSLELISGLFLDLDPAIHRNGGQIHNYVGDEIVMSWPDRSKAENGRVLRAVAEMFETIDKARDDYLGKFDAAPGLRVGIAAGPVAVGEAGWEKRQVVYIGQTINVAKRLQEASKSYGVSVMTDDQTLERMEMPEGFHAFEMGRTTLRGRETETLMMAFGPNSGPYSQPRLGN